MGLIGNIGILGLLGMTILFPGVFFFLGRKIFIKSANKKRDADESDLQKKSPPVFPLLTVLIPSHNEEKVIAATISSIQNSILCASKMVNIENNYFLKDIKVGADRCTDSTVKLANEKGANVLEGNFGSKWENLRALVALVDTPWVALVDAGSIWPEDFFHYLIPYFKKEEVVGIAPGYQEITLQKNDSENSDITNFVSKLKALNWWMERSLKFFENTVGGPISVHGATVLYRTEALKNVFTYLDKTKPGFQWINDDVVIPLVLRMQNPEKDIRYFLGDGVHTLISDVGITKEDGVEKSRRLRILRGNLDWIEFLFPQVFKLNWALGLLACRRIFRVLWAYWVLFIASQIFFDLRGLVAWLYLGVATVIIFAFKRAFIASITTPYLLLRRKKRGEIRWG